MATALAAVGALVMSGGLVMLASVIGLYVVSAAHGTPSYLFSDLQGISIDPGTQKWLFVGFFIAFAVKAPLFPVHTWLPDTTEQATTGTSVLLVEFDPFDAANMDSTQLPSSSQTLGGMLLLECENVVGLSETTEQRMRNVSLQGGLSATKNLMRDAQRLYFEPFSQKAVAPFNADPSNPTPVMPAAGDPATAAIDAFIITGNGVSAPSVEVLATPDWVPPTDLAPLTAAMRTPIAFACE